VLMKRERKEKKLRPRNYPPRPLVRNTLHNDVTNGRALFQRAASIKPAVASGNYLCPRNRPERTGSFLLSTVINVISARLLPALPLRIQPSLASAAPTGVV